MTNRTSSKPAKAAKTAARPAAAKAAGRPPRARQQPAATGGKAEPASRLIDARIKELGGWRGETLRKLRAIITAADPEIVEEWKWETPVWSCDGIICTGEAYKAAVKMTFAKGAALEDPARLFNSSLEGKVRRAIDVHEGEEIDEAALKNLIRAAVALNRAGKGAGKGPAAAARPVLLTGGNPQIPKGEGDGPVQAFIAASPGWKSDVGRQLDALITRTIPDVRKAVKWNSPFYGIEGQGWFLSFHCMTKYVKVALFRGASLHPLPPVESKDRNTRYFHIHEKEAIDEAQVADWIRQAAALPGWVP